jgi:hypothetical protein
MEYNIYKVKGYRIKKATIIKEGPRMKKLTLMLITALLLTAVPAGATGYPTIFAGRWDVINVFRPGFPEPIATIPVLGDYPGMAYDGEYWWAIQDDYIFSFDRNGDLVSSFPSPAPEPRGLAYDGEYLWISCWALRADDVRIYDVNLDGTPGPYPDFPAVGVHGLTIYEEYVLALRTSYVRFYSKDGSFIKDVFLESDPPYLLTFSITSDDEYLWVCCEHELWDYPRLYKFDPDTGERLDGAGYWTGTYRSMSMGIWTDTGIEIESLGKIKAFFE